MPSPTLVSETFDIRDRVEALARRSKAIHEDECLNLNPATNVMNPRAEALLSSGLGTRPSLGDPGDKYEMGLEAIEEIELITADAARRVFTSTHAEIRVPSGAMANLMTFMALCRPGDAIIVPPASIGGHVTHHDAGAAGLFGLEIHEAPVDAERYTVDVTGLADLAERVRPSLITIGSSLNLLPHPVADIADVARSVDARLLFDAAHVCGLLAGGHWPNPLATSPGGRGADLVTMSTYKSLAGPPGGLIVTNDDEIMERIRSVAYPGVTANFDVAKSAALAITLNDWLDDGPAQARAMVGLASALADELQRLDLPVFSTLEGPTTTHQFAIEADQWGDGHQAALRLRRANLLTSAIGLPTSAGTGIRFGTPELSRTGVVTTDASVVADFIHRALTRPEHELESVARSVTSFRKATS